MDSETQTDLDTAIREHGERAILDGDIEREEMDVAIAAIRRGDERKARRFFLLLLSRDAQYHGY